MLDTSTSAVSSTLGPPHLTIEMRGRNVVIRTPAVIDEGYTVALVEAINAAVVTDTVVIIDPEPVRCDDLFAADERSTASLPCPRHRRCEPVAAEVVNSRMIRIAAERDSWTIDLRSGRLCQASPRTHHLYIGPDSWMPVVAVVVTPTRLSALTTDDVVITTTRAHRAPVPM